MVVLSADTGQVTAVLLDGGYLTTLRTAAAGAVAAKWLANDPVRTLGIVGTGEQARWQARAAALVRPPERILVYGRRPERASELALELSGKLDVEARPVAGLEELVRTSDLVVTATAAREPLVLGEWLHAGLHITAVGADAPDKQELAGDVLAKADRVVSDLTPQCLEIGECQHWPGAGRLDGKGPVELGAVITGRELGRTRTADVTVCDLTGVGIQDTVVARYALAGLGYGNSGGASGPRGSEGGPASANGPPTGLRGGPSEGDAQARRERSRT